MASLTGSQHTGGSASSGTVPKKQRGLIAKFQVGSVHGQCNYKMGEAAFHRVDVPPAKRKMKLSVMASSKPDILGTKKSAWNLSVATNVPLCQRRMRQLSKYDAPVYRYNYRAEVLPRNTVEYIPKAGRLNFDRRKAMARNWFGLLLSEIIIDTVLLIRN